MCTQEPGAGDGGVLGAGGARIIAEYGGASRGRMARAGAGGNDVGTVHRQGPAEAPGPEWLASLWIGYSKHLADLNAVVRPSH